MHAMLLRENSKGDAMRSRFFLMVLSLSIAIPCGVARAKAPLWNYASQANFREKQKLPTNVVQRKNARWITKKHA